MSIQHKHSKFILYIMQLCCDYSYLQVVNEGQAIPEGSGLQEPHLFVTSCCCLEVTQLKESLCPAHMQLTLEHVKRSVSDRPENRHLHHTQKTQVRFHPGLLPQVSQEKNHRLHFGLF